ncbi:unnamed protein product [Tenebrio molitor]|nr:unnamed protein product [Tenebrio molitor]
MPRKSLIPLTDEEKFKLQEQLEQELGCLQRQYSLLEKDRHQYACGIKLNRLNKIVNIYKREHANIDTDLEVASAPAKKRIDAKDTEQLSKLLEERDFNEEEVTHERQYILEIDGQIKKVEKEVVKLRSQQITDRQHEERVWAAMKTVEMLENKLDVQNKKFGVICAKNREMKREIKRMLWERDMFMRIWNKMIDKLVLGKKFMMDLIEQATIAYDQREEWCSKLQALRIKAHYDFIYHTQEMRELKRRQDNNKKLEDFYNVKGQRRVMKDLETKERLRRAENKAKLKEQLALYRNYMADILEFTKKSEVEAIAKTYYIQEAENFSLFKRVNNLIGELEFLNDALGYLHEDIDQQRATNNARLEQQRITIENLEEKLSDVEKAVKHSEEELNDVEEYISKMLAGIDSLFKICRCNRDPILQLLGDNTTINVYNVFLYLEMVEKTVHQALVDVYYNEKAAFDKKKITGTSRIVKDDRAKGELVDVDQVAGSNPCPLCVEYEMVSDVIDTLQHVMSRRQVKAVLRERLVTTDMSVKIHNVSECYLPKSREIIQRRYQ